MNGLIALGHGNTADVYEWEEDSVLKLFKPGYEDNADKEFHITQQITKTGLRVPKAKIIINFNNRKGIIYDRIRGTEMYSEMQRQPFEIEKWGRLFADLHYEIHLHSCPSLSSPREELNSIIKNCNILDLEVRKKIFSIFEELDDDNILCHGDFHPLNVIITKEVPYIIDWINSRAFHPLADVALSSIILRVATGLPSWIIEFHDLYIQNYLQLSSFDYRHLVHWLLPMAIVRLNENKISERDRILKLIDENLRLI